MGLKNSDGQMEGAKSGKSSNGFIPTSFRALSRIVSSGAATVASTVRSAASAIVDRDNDSTHDQVLWAGFDKLECEGGATRQILLLGCRYGFQVWDVEDSDNVHNLVSRQDGPVSFMQILPKPIASKKHEDKFSGSPPVLILCADTSFSGGSNIREGIGKLHDGTIQQYHDQESIGFVPTAIWFYSLTSHSYVHQLKFRSVVHLVRCSSRVIAILQAAQIHCFDAATLDREYTVVTNPVITGFSGSRSVGVGPLALGPRWMAYSGSPVTISNSGHVNPQHVTPSDSLSSPATNGSVIAHYAKESSKQLAAGIVTLGDVGYKKLARYYSDLSPDGNSSQSGNARAKILGIANGHFPGAGSVGMVIVRDIVSKALIAQFRAHKSPISALCFDPSSTLLVTASVQGHNINVFRIMPILSENTSASDPGSSYVHLYRLQRGLTNAAIQDISFSSDSQWIMISSSRGTSHLFTISASGETVDFRSSDACLTTRSNGSGVMEKLAVHCASNSKIQVLNQQNIGETGPPATLSVVGRIRSGSNGWRNTVNGAAAAATGWTSSFSGSITSAFRHCKSTNQCADLGLLKANYHLLVFSSPGCMTQYALRMCSELDFIPTIPAIGSTYGAGPEVDTRLVVKAIQKWNIFQKQNCKERDDNTDIYGEFGSSDSSKVFPEGITKGSGLYSKTRDTITKGKISSEEKHHIYISEAELQMHKPRNPLWAKPEVYFQSLDMDRIYVVDGCGGEAEVEVIPTHMVEARSKHLVPVFNHLQASKTQQGRLHVHSDNGQKLSPRPEISENSKLTLNSGCASSDGSSIELHHCRETACNSLRMTSHISRDFINSSDSPEAATRLDFVNNTRSTMMQTNQSL
ncbi:autophagy-related protein 18f-like [Nicotiana tomentosiformis]|uniref:autophagy-related protein 18f-like n=1 Tax=Nicotiana tomentosiformis TaxID=4098 RepID=UPI00051BE978|nr:autophagy-related protein 18f-like [Nicotiana tomentosiformis]XP_033517103.1 autophagy-related protein 18f-like [Nicotiana tomentosiformis]